MKVQDILPFMEGAYFRVTNPEGHDLAHTSDTPDATGTLDVIRLKTDGSGIEIIAGIAKANGNDFRTLKQCQLDGNRELRIYENSAWVYYHKTGCTEFLTSRSKNQPDREYIRTVLSLEQRMHKAGWI